MDPNVHPWVAASWQRCRAMGLPNQQGAQLPHLSAEELSERQRKNAPIMGYLHKLYDALEGYFDVYNLSFLVLDTDCYILKSYAMPFFHPTIGSVEGMRVQEQDMGTSSIVLAKEHQVPFLIFGPEIWLEEYQYGDAFSAPIIVSGKVVNIISLVGMNREELPYDALFALLVSIQQGAEQYLIQRTQREKQDSILDAVPFGLYRVAADTTVTYANETGQKRLAEILPPDAVLPIRLKDVILNFDETPLPLGLAGVTAHNADSTWVTRRKTYDDFTTVVPDSGADTNGRGLVMVSWPIEDARNMVAYAAGFKARYTFASMTGESPAFVKMLEQAKKYAALDGGVLLQGGAGSGKRRLAEAMHNASVRAHAPFVAVGCAELAPELLEMELFGTADDDCRPGKLELANGGTLFLDEIEVMPLSLQLRLAEVLRSGGVHRQGGSTRRPVQVRILSGANVNLAAAVQRDAFDKELYALVAEHVLAVPQLAERREDIPSLVQEIIRERALHHGIGIKRLTEKAMEKLEDYAWPGNIQELQRVLEEAFFASGKAVLDADDIRLGEEKDRHKGKNVLWKKDRDNFVSQWEQAGGNISLLAQRLGVSRVTVYRYMKKFGMPY